MADKSYKLNTGQSMPALGLGTWQSKAGEVEKAVSYALQNGYRLVDGAYCYANEEEVGKGLKEAFDAGIKREDVFVVTKLWGTYQTSDERVQLGLDKSLKSLGLDYVDLFLVHWPVALNPDGNHDRFPTLPGGKRDIVHSHSHTDTWKSMEKLLATGKTRAIGVSNYSKPYLEQLLASASVVPAVNQVENHPSLPQDDVVGFCREKGIHVMGYSPFGSTGGPLFTAAPVAKISEKHGVPPSAVLLGYHIARGNTVLAKSTSPDRIKANLQVADLDEEDMKLLNEYSADLTAKKELKRYVYPPFGVQFGFPDKMD